MEESQRQKKIGSVLRKDLAEIINKLLRDGGTKGIIVSISKVGVTVDLTVAKV